MNKYKEATAPSVDLGTDIKVSVSSQSLEDKETVDFKGGNDVITLGFSGDTTKVYLAATGHGCAQAQVRIIGQEFLQQIA